MTTVNRRQRRHWLIQDSLFAALLISLAGALGYLAWETRVQWDVSQNGRNSLSPASVEVLQNLHGPIAVTVFATARDPQLGSITKIIKDFLALYQRVKPDFIVTFIDPVEQPQSAHEAGIQANGEMVVEFNGRREQISTFNEQTLTNSLMRMARSGEKLVVALGGHGERKLDGTSSRDLGEFGKQLVVKGFRTDIVNPIIAGDLPADTSVLLISSPQVDLPEGAVDKVLAYVARGGNLLWLLDQEPLHGLQPLAEQLNLTLTPGVVVDPHARQLNVPITFALGANYGLHPVTHNFDYVTLFPFARQIAVDENEEWRSVSLVEAGHSGWVETGKLNTRIAFDPMYDVSGPISIAAVLSRTLPDREQRIAVIGSGYFLANAYLGHGKNVDFGVNLVNWLAGDENLIFIQPLATLDGNLELDQSTLMLIAWGFLIVLPLIFLASGTIIWWKRGRG